MKLSPKGCKCGVIIHLLLHARLITSSTTGNVHFQCAQNVATVVDTIVYDGLLHGDMGRIRTVTYKTKEEREQLIAEAKLNKEILEHDDVIGEVETV